MVASASPDDIVTHADGLRRCWWCGSDSDYVAYHDREWARPEHDEQRLFEKLCLEGFQAGLSWLTVLRRRPVLREVFAGFEPDRLLHFGERDVERILGDERVIRHEGKIRAVLHNARVVTDLSERRGSLDAFVWRFAPDLERVPIGRTDVPVSTPESAALADALRAEGWRFIGPTSAYAFMQAMGLVNDHVAGCSFRDTS